MAILQFFPMQRYTIQRELAATRTGQVLLCVDRNDGRQVVVKRVQVVFVDNAAPATSMELQVHRHLCLNGGHPNILKLLDSFTMDDGYEYMVVEYCNQGELFDLVESAPNRRMAPSVVCEYFATICAAVKYMHGEGFAHCDLSLENILVDDHGVLKLSDFGLATTVHSCRQNLVGKLFYMAPEMHLMDAYDPAKADVWSLGVMLFIMLTGSPPFETSHASDSSMQFVANKGIRALCVAWQLDHVIPSEAMDLLENLLVINPAERWSLDQLCRHSYVLHAFSDAQPQLPPSRKASLLQDNPLEA